MTKLSNRFLELQLELSSILHTSVSMWIKQRLIKSVTGVLFVITYYPKLKEMKKYQNILYQDETIKRVFTPFPMVLYRNTRKLSSYLVRAKLYPLERKRSSY